MRNALPLLLREFHLPVLEVRPAHLAPSQSMRMLTASRRPGSGYPLSPLCFGCGSCTAGRGAGALRRDMEWWHEEGLVLGVARVRWAARDVWLSMDRMAWLLTAVLACS